MSERCLPIAGQCLAQHLKREENCRKCRYSLIHWRFYAYLYIYVYPQSSPLLIRPAASLGRAGSFRVRRRDSSKDCRNGSWLQLHSLLSQSEIVMKRRAFLERFGVKVRRAEFRIGRRTGPFIARTPHFRSLFLPQFGVFWEVEQRDTVFATPCRNASAYHRSI